MLIFKDLSGSEYIVYNDYTISDGVYGEKNISTTLVGDISDLTGIGAGWQIIEQNNKSVFYVTGATPSSEQGGVSTINVTGVYDLAWKMNKSVSYGVLPANKVVNGNEVPIKYSADVLLTKVFKDSGFSFRQYAFIDDIYIEGFGDERRWVMLSRLMDIWGVDFEYDNISKTVYIVAERGDSLTDALQYNINLESMNKEINATELITYQKGYGKYIDPEDESKGRVEAEYKSTSANIYGVLEGTPIDDTEMSLDELRSALRNSVERSMPISEGINVLNFDENDRTGLIVGNRVQLINDDLKYNKTVRIVRLSTTYDRNGYVISSTATCGGLSLVDRRRQAQFQRNKAMTPLVSAMIASPKEYNNVAQNIAALGTGGGGVPADIQSKLDALNTKIDNLGKKVESLEGELKKTNDRFADYATKSWVETLVNGTLGVTRSMLNKILNLKG